MAYFAGLRRLLHWWTGTRTNNPRVAVRTRVVARLVAAEALFSATLQEIIWPSGHAGWVRDVLLKKGKFLEAQGGFANPP